MKTANISDALYTRMFGRDYNCQYLITSLSELPYLHTLIFRHLTGDRPCSQGDWTRPFRPVNHSNTVNITHIHKCFLLSVPHHTIMQRDMSQKKHTAASLIGRPHMMGTKMSQFGRKSKPSIPFCIRELYTCDRLESGSRR